MPNFWSTTNQKLYESFYGPKTFDTEFNSKVEEVIQAEKSLHQFQKTISRFHHHHGGIRSYMMDMASAFENLYDKDSVIYPHSSQIVTVHKEIAKLYDTYHQKIVSLHAGTLNWYGHLDTLKDNVKERDRLRMIHDHYDDKLEKYVKKRTRYLEKGHSESPRFIDAFERNNLKYKEATEKYLNHSRLTYKIMCEFLEYRKKILHPFMSNVISEEINFFSQANNLLMGLTDIGEKLRSTEQDFDKKAYLTYDPSKYIRGKHIIDTQYLQQQQLNVLPTSSTTEIRTSQNLAETVLPQTNVVSTFIKTGVTTSQNLEGTAQPHTNLGPTSFSTTGVTISKDLTGAAQTQPKQYIHISSQGDSSGMFIKEIPETKSTIQISQPNVIDTQEANLVHQPFVPTGYTHEKIKIEDEDQHYLSEDEPTVTEIHQTPTAFSQGSELHKLNINITNINPEIKHEVPLNYSVLDSTTTKTKINLQDLKDSTSQ